MNSMENPVYVDLSKQSTKTHTSSLYLFHKVPLIKTRQGAISFFCMTNHSRDKIRILLIV